MERLHRLWPRREFSLPPFEPAPLEFIAEAIEGQDELLLDEVVARIGPVPQPGTAARAMPTAGELRASIERHLSGGRNSAPPVDAAEELRNALAELRRSIR